MKIDAALAFRLIEGARKRGSDLAEAYIVSYKNLSVEARDRQLDAVESSADFGYSLRVIRDGRLGFSFSNDAEDADDVIERAVEASRWTERDEFLDLPEPAEHESIDTFDVEVAALSEQEALDQALSIEDAALSVDPRIKKVRKAGVSCSSAEHLILNSKGLEKTYSATSCSAQITVVATEDGDSRMGWDFDGARFLNGVDFDNVGKRAADAALSLLGSRKISAVRADVILDRSVATDFLGIFAGLLSSEAVQKGKSLLARRVGNKVISQYISIVDDGLLEQRLGSRPFDGEGVPTCRKSLIERGVLKGYMYNVYTSRKDGVASTGNAARGGFGSPPSVGPSVLFIESSSETLSRQRLLSLPEKCLYVTDAMGVHTANPVSGEFSIGVSGLWVENGDMKFPVSEAVISGNILDFFGKVKAVADDVRFYGSTGSPSLLIEAVDISG